MSTADPDSDARVDLAHFDELYSTKAIEALHAELDGHEGVCPRHITFFTNRSPPRPAPAPAAAAAAGHRNRTSQLQPESVRVRSMPPRILLIKSQSHRCVGLIC
jgi:hypothetical protein